MRCLSSKPAGKGSGAAKKVKTKKYNGSVPTTAAAQLHKTLLKEMATELEGMKEISAVPRKPPKVRLRCNRVNRCAHADAFRRISEQSHCIYRAGCG